MSRTVIMGGLKYNVRIYCKIGWENGQMIVYKDFFCNHASDLQISQTIHWIIRENKDGIFHIGTSDLTGYQSFIELLINAMGMKQPEFVFQKIPAVMAVFSSRRDIPDELKWNSTKLIQYLCEKS